MTCHSPDLAPVPRAADPRAPDPLASPALRHRLARGHARAVLARAESADEAAVFEALRALPLGAKGAARALARLDRRPGVVQVARAARAAVVVTRQVCDVTVVHEGEVAFTERGLIYTRLAVRQTRGWVHSTAHRASFSAHALERLVQRSDTATDRLAEAIDGEAAALLRAFARGAVIAARGDAYLAARVPGVWAGSVDRTAGEPVWSGDGAVGPVPTFSARTFLGEDEMPPHVWWHWRQAPAQRGAPRGAAA